MTSSIGFCAELGQRRRAVRDQARRVAENRARIAAAGRALVDDVRCALGTKQGLAVSFATGFAFSRFGRAAAPAAVPRRVVAVSQSVLGFAELLLRLRAVVTDVRSAQGSQSFILEDENV